MHEKTNRTKAAHSGRHDSTAQSLRQIVPFKNMYIPRVFPHCVTLQAQTCKYFNGILCDMPTQST